MLAEFRAVGIALDVELAHGIHAQQHAAWAARLHVVFSSPSEFDAVEQKDILLRAVAGDGETVSCGGV